MPSLVVRVGYFDCVILNSQDIFVNVHHVGVTMRKSEFKSLFPNIASPLGGADNRDSKLVSEAFQDVILGWDHHRQIEQTFDEDASSLKVPLKASTYRLALGIKSLTSS